jgi:hypothetical protein
MTTGALAAFRELGPRVGEDVRVATHVNAGSVLLYGYESRLARVEVDPAEVVRASSTCWKTSCAARRSRSAVASSARACYQVHSTRRVACRSASGRAACRDADHLENRLSV